MNGGYLMIFKNDSDIYAKAQKALVLGKPILFYENATTCYYIDTISGGEVTSEIIDDEEVTTYGDIILTKGGKTITITSANAVTETGNIQQTTENFDALMENIVDSAGNKRFIEGDGIPSTIEGVTFNFNKWSLSGSHLMFVLSGEMANGTAIAGAQTYSTYEIPKWVYDKIIPYVNNRVEIKGQYYYDNSYGTQTATSLLIKDTITETIKIITSAITLNTDRSFRVQFDLLIDSEYSE